MTKPSDLLQMCADVFSFPETHCKGFYAKSIDGSVVGPLAPNADKWCSIGAIDAAASTLRAPFELTVKARAYLNKAGNCKGAIAHWNDSATTTKTMVQQTFQKAADLARKDKQ